MSPTPKPYFSSRAAVSPIVSVLLMVGVALALAGFVGLYMTSYVSSTSNIVSLTITDVDLLKVNGHLYFHVTLRNTGSVPARIVDVAIYTPSKTYSTNRSLSIGVASGSSVSITEEDLKACGLVLDPADFELGSSYLVRVFADSGGHQTAYSITVVCQG